MENSTNYDLKLYEGGDKFNPLNVDVPNFETIDEVMKANETAGVQLATELVSGTVHEITRSNADAHVFRFVATAKWGLGDSMSIDGTPVTVLLPSGKSIPDGAYVIGANVLGVLVGTNCTLYLSETGGTAEDSEKLGGELPSYYATASGLENTNTVVTAQGQIITSNTQRITALEQSTSDANNLGAYENVPQGSWLTTNSDGYVDIFAPSITGSTIHFVTLTLRGATGDASTDMTVTVWGNNQGMTNEVFFVRKGMKLQIMNKSSSASASARFYPLV